MKIKVIEIKGTAKEFSDAVNEFLDKEYYINTIQTSVFRNKDEEPYGAISIYTAVITYE